MGTVVNGIERRSRSGKIVSHSQVKSLELFERDQSFGHAPLVADYDHGVPGTVKQRNRLGNAGQELHVLPSRDVLPFGGFAVNVH
jgi:hypothetical protein